MTDATDDLDYQLSGLQDRFREIDEIDKAAVRAMKATNLCTKHMEYHGQKYKSCTPQERVMIKLTNPKNRNNEE